MNRISRHAPAASVGSLSIVRVTGKHYCDRYAIYMVQLRIDTDCTCRAAKYLAAIQFNHYQSLNRLKIACSRQHKTRSDIKSLRVEDRTMNRACACGRGMPDGHHLLVKPFRYYTRSANGDYNRTTTLWTILSVVQQQQYLVVIGHTSFRHDHMSPTNTIVYTGTSQYLFLVLLKFWVGYATAVSTKRTKPSICDPRAVDTILRTS